LQFQCVHVAHKLLVHLLHQRGIARETAGIQIAHLIDQSLQLLPSLGTILYRGPNLVEKVQSLVDLALGVGRVRALLGCHGLTGDAAIAGVIGAIPVTIAPTARIASGYAIADRTRLSALSRLPALSTLTSGLTSLTTLTWLRTLTALTGLIARALLSGLAVSRLLLAGLTLTGLAATACLPLSAWRTGLSVRTSTQVAELIAQTRQIVHGAVKRSVLGSVLTAAQGPTGVADLPPQFLQVARKSGLSLIGEAAGTQLIRTALQARTEIVFVHAIERTAQFPGSPRLRRRQFTGSLAHLLGQARQIVAHLLAIVDHFVDFLGGRVFLLLSRGASGVLLSHQLPHAIRLLLLLRR
jgi:hypothetical protein